MRGRQRIFLAKKPTLGRYSDTSILIVAALFGVAASAFGAEMLSGADVSLTETEALRLGLSRSGLQEALEGEIGLARSDALEASLWPNPVASYAREEISDEALGSAEDFAWLTQQFDLSGRRRLRTKAAEHRVQAVTFRTESQRLEIEAEIRRRFYEVLQRQELVDAVEEWSSRMQTIAETVAKRERGGEVSGYDRRRLDRERASTRARLREEQAALDRAREQLAAILGESTKRRAAWPKVVGDLLPVSHPRPIDDLLAELSTRPDLQAHDQTVAESRGRCCAVGR